MNIKNNGKFDRELLKSPPRDCNVAYSWTWNGPVTREGIDERLAGFARAGIRCLYILPLPKDFRPERLRTFLWPEYLTEEFFDLVRYALLRARELGIYAWIYDEGGWPSGGACGNTVRSNPEARLEGLAKKEITLEGDQRFTPFPGFVALFNGKRRLPDDYIAPCAMTLTVYYAVDETTDGNRVDGTSLSATETFIDNTYEAYKSAVGDMFGEDLPLFFTDEPGLLRQTLAKGIFEKFIDEYGYDLRDYVYVIEDNGAMALTDREIRARIDWATLTGKLYVENTFAPLHDWCEKSGVYYSGHLDLDNRPWGAVAKGYFSFIECLRKMHVPGIDVIWEQIRLPYDGSCLDDETRGMGFFPRLAASAAHAEGRNLALTETFSIYGDGLSPDEIKYALNYQAIRGINLFNVLTLPYSKDRCGALMMRPALCPEKPGFYNLKHINEYYAGLSYLLRLGVDENHTALYHPCSDYAAGIEGSDLASISYKAAGTALEAENVQFDIIDDGCVRDAEATPEGLRLGSALYTHVTVPECRYMPEDVREKLAPYIGKGDPAYRFESENLRVLTRKLYNSRLYFVFNEGYETVSEALKFTEYKNVYRIDAASGRMYREDSPIATLACGDIAVYLVTDGEYAADTDEVVGSAEIGELTPVCYDRTIIDYNSVRSVHRDGAPDVDESFSGTVYYEADYTLPDISASTARITLTDTGVSATLLSDGEYLCDLGMSPTVAYVPAERLGRSGRLTVALSNTAANEVLSRMDVIKSHPASEVGSYNERMRPFEARRHPLRLGRVSIELLK